MRLDFRTVADRVMSAHAHGRYREALESVREAAPRFPDRAESIAYWEACLLARLNEPAQALLALRHGLQRGLWWSPEMLRRDPDLESVREDAEFVAIVEACERQLREAQAQAVLQLQVYRPSAASAASPLLIALHWRFRHLADFTPWWLPAVRQGTVLAIPRSSQQLGMDAFGWDDRERTTRDIAEAYDRLRTAEQGDTRKVLLAGASQGGAVALELALAGSPVPAQGFILVVPAIHDVDAVLADAASAAQRGLQGWVVTGDRDYGRDQAIALGERLTQWGIPCHVDVVPGLGHEFPGDFEARLPAALAYVLA